MQIKMRCSRELPAGILDTMPFRDAARIARVAYRYPCSVLLRFEGGFINAKNLDEVAGLKPHLAGSLILETVGPDAEACLDELWARIQAGPPLGSLGA